MSAVPGEAVRYARWEAGLAALAERYRTNAPVPHLAFDDFLDPALARTVAAAFPAEPGAHRVRYRHVNENKASTDRREDLPPAVVAALDELNSPRFVAFLRRLTGIADLVADPDIEGGGMHQAWAGGYLNVHTDFTVHRRRAGWRRRCNLILYLNEGWDPAWGGAFELWAADMSRCVDAVPCTFNRAVVFDTPGARHGFPDPLRCPPGQSRKSLQLYYYSVDPAPPVRATTYYGRPSDPALRRLLVRVDNGLLALYSAVKRRLGLSDAAVSRVMREVDRIRARRR
jgi:hypothetical protein